MELFLLLVLYPGNFSSTFLRFLRMTERITRAHTAAKQKINQPGNLGKPPRTGYRKAISDGISFQLPKLFRLLTFRV